MLNRSQRWRAGASLAKGLFMSAFGIGVLIEAIYKVFVPIMTDSDAMGIVGALALIASLVCCALLHRHRGDNLHMSSTWLCSRSDVIASVGVQLAAAAAYLIAARRPDVLTAALSPVSLCTRPLT